MKLRGLVVVLAISCCIAAWACGAATGVGFFDDFGSDGGGQDATLDSVGNAHGTDATVDSSGDVVLVDAAVDSPTGHEAGDAGGTDATPDSAPDVLVADVAVDAASGSDAGSVICPAGNPPSGTCSPDGVRCTSGKPTLGGPPDCEICFCQNGVWGDCGYCAASLH